MGTRVACCACGTDMDSNDGYLRPEGFVCRTCYQRRIADPAYAADMERQLAGAVSALNVRPSASSPPTLVQPRDDAERRAFDSLVGLAVGDALGAPWEGSPIDPSRRNAVEPRDDVAPWTDDTQMAIGIVEVLQQCGGIDQDRLAAIFANRYEGWRGYGAGMHVVLQAIKEGQPWRVARETVFREGSFGNGAAMRVAPLGAFLADAPIDEAVRQAELSADVTHSHPEGRAGAVATTVAAWLASRSRGHDVFPRGRFLELIAPHVEPDLELVARLQEACSLPPDTPIDTAARTLGNGAKVTSQDTVPLALWLAFRHLHDYEEGIRQAITAGGDTDTLAAIVGGVIASYLGAEAIPVRWRSMVEPLPLA